MADASSLLASIISGTSPLAPDMLQAYQGAQLSNAGLDPNYGHNEGPFGALGKMLAAARGGPMLQQGVQATTAGNMAAMPDLAKLLASPDAFTALAGNTAGTNPVAAARLLAGATPGSVAEARLKAAQATLAGAQANEINNVGQPRTWLGGGAAGAPGGGGGIGTPKSFSEATGDSARADPLAALAGQPDDVVKAKLAQIKATNPTLWALLLKKRGGGVAPRP